MRKELIEKLSAPLDVKERRGTGGKTFKYVSGNDVYTRLNEVFEGNWSTEVKEDKIMEDNILMRVRVTVADPKGDNPNFFYQDGFASHPALRFTTGDRKGQFVDLGNSYKSAMTKAIKAAVVKWGLGLNLDEEGEDAPESFGAHYNVPAEAAPKKTSTSFAPPVFSPPFTSAPPVSEPKVEAPVHKAPPPFAAPPSFASSAPAENLVVESQSSKQSFPTPPVSAARAESVQSIEYLTAVQRVAIETVMAVHGMSFEELAAKALQRTDNLPDTIEKVPYAEAVRMIQYGNNLKTVR